MTDPLAPAPPAETPPADAPGSAPRADAAAPARRPPDDDPTVTVALLVAPAYLVVLALAVVAGRPRPPVGGLAALVAILLARWLLARATRARGGAGSGA